VIADCNIETEAFAVDFATHARAMGAAAEDVHSIDGLKEAFFRAQASRKTYVICLKVDAHEGWTNEGHTWWEIGTPSVSKRSQVRDAHQEVERGRSRQRPGV
jgi:3D-(3,5/4)-trihydroxycyclohexane-1,2-dione acylhydrolase (decyclizing)